MIQNAVPASPRAAGGVRRIELQAYEYQALYVTATHPGSVFIGAALGSFAVWVLSSIVGETFKDACKSSELHKRLFEFFSRDLLRKADSIARLRPRPRKRSGRIS